LASPIIYHVLYAVTETPHITRIDLI